MKLWGGRFTKSADKMTEHFHSSISFDKRLYKHDINGSMAHAEMLGRQGVIGVDEAELIIKTLAEILSDIESGVVEFDESAEDIHMNIETILIKRIGDTGKKLHTGRSRNDQVSLDMRLYIKEEILDIKKCLAELNIVINSIARDNVHTIMPGFTHLQPAQPITLAHHILAYFEMFDRDYGRLSDCYNRMNFSPLGSGALAATTFPLDRSFVAEKLNFLDITKNSLDAVSDRDFCVELLSALSMIMMHLSRFCEEIILWSTHEFKFIELDDAYSTGSSIMPQKKNPDMAELIRGKTGRVYGDLIGMLTIMKGLPLAYNKDMQEDKETVFDGIDTVKACLGVFCGMIKTMKINTEKMTESAKLGFINATDAADWLVGKGVPFREAHEIIGKLVLYSINANKSLLELTLDEYKLINPIFDESIYDAVSLETCVNARTVAGGPSPEYIKKLIDANQGRIGNY